MIRRITHTSIYVRDVDEALKWYTDVLGFAKRSDSPMPEMGGARWVTVSPQEQPELEIVLESPSWAQDETTVKAREAVVGKQPGLVLETDDVRGAMETLKNKGVTFTMELTEFPWGTQTMFEDLYGNAHVLSQPPEH